MRRSSLRSRTPDYLFVGLLAALVVFGLVMLASASSDLAKLRFGDSFYYLKHQIYFGLLPGVVGFFAGLFVPLRKLEKFAVPMLVISIVFLALVFTPLGLQIKGSDRWLALGPLSFQPGELIKLTFLVFLGSWIARNKERIKSFVKGFVPFLILLGAVTGLLVAQPSTSIAVIIFLASAAMYFAAGARFRFLFAAGVLLAIAVGGLILVTPYRMERILSYLHPNSDPLGATYHINQAVTAIGAGGIWGVGYGQSTTKLKYLPEPIGDSIFAVIGEELGFVGALSLVLIFMVFVLRGFAIARGVTDMFSRLLVIGFISLIGFQAFINIAAISGIIPLTGVPLPFVSYGGTALAVFLTMGGIVANISRYEH